MELTECFETSSHKILTHILYIFPTYIAYEDGTDSAPKRRHTKFLIISYFIPPMKMELTEYSETSAYKILVIYISYLHRL
jgi:hypothetical protein